MNKSNVQQQSSKYANVFIAFYAGAIASSIILVLGLLGLGSYILTILGEITPGITIAQSMENGAKGMELMITISKYIILFTLAVCSVTALFIWAGTNKPQTRVNN